MANEWDDGSPDWHGSEGEQVEFLLSDGSVMRGKFDMEDSGFDGESSYPIWYVELSDGRRMDFYSDLIKGWREVDAS